MKGLLMNCKGCERRSLLKCYLGICVEELRKVSTNLSRVYNSCVFFVIKFDVVDVNGRESSALCNTHKSHKYFYVM
jgi:hypothetical protein